MKVFHSSPLEVSAPDTLHSREALDFGKGFYLTPNRNQAIDYANRFKREGLDAYLNIYVLDEGFRNTFKVKEFYSYNEEWLDFIIANRLKQQIDENYDIIIGGIANDRIFNTLNLFMDGLIDKKEALNRLIFHKPNLQICILNQVVIDTCLNYIEAIKI